jgi:hypothetical protein
MGRKDYWLWEGRSAQSSGRFHCNLTNIILVQPEEGTVEWKLFDIKLFTCLHVLVCACSCVCVFVCVCVCVCVCVRESLILFVFCVLVILFDMCNITALLADWSFNQCLWSHLWIIVIFTGEWQGSYCIEVWVIGRYLDGWKNSREGRYAVCGVHYWHPCLRTGCWGGYLGLRWRKW